MGQTIPNPLASPEGEKPAEFLAYVEDKIKEFREIAHLSESNEVHPARLNKALSEFTDILLGLITEYQKAELVQHNIATQFEKWYDVKFAEERHRLNDETSASVKPSTKEIENAVRVKYATEHEKWRDAVAYSEFRSAYIKRLMGGLDKFDRILTTISNNMKQEMRSLSLDSRMNTNPAVAESNKVRRFPISASEQ